MNELRVEENAELKLAAAAEFKEQPEAIGDRSGRMYQRIFVDSSRNLC